MQLPIPESLETDRLVLTRLRPEDAEEIFYTYASKQEATKYVAWPTHTSLQDTRTYIASASIRWKLGEEYSFAVRQKEHRRLIGGCGFVHQAGNIQLGYILGPLHWNQGYGTEVCRRMVALFRELPGIYRVGTFVDSENIASSKVLLKSGLVEEARLSKWFSFVNQGGAPKDCTLFKLPI